MIMSKIIGSNAERQLVHEFWKRGWPTIRVAGSGSMKYPCPDLIVGKEKRKIVIECKTTKKKNKYFTKEEVSDLKTFAKMFGAEAWLAVRFGKRGWFFVQTTDLKIKEKSLVLTLDNALRMGKTIDKLLD